MLSWHSPKRVSQSLHGAKKFIVSSWRKIVSNRHSSEPAPEIQDSVSRNWERLIKRLLLISADPETLVLSEDIAAIFFEIEASTGFQVDDETRKRYYLEFSKLASPHGLLASSKIQLLISTLGIEIRNSVLKLLINKRSEDEDKSVCEVWDGNLGSSQVEFNFRAFLHLLFDIHDYLHSHQQLSETEPESIFSFKDRFPIDPECFEKQLWDGFCMTILLYCSFAVPYSIAFAQNTPGDQLSIMDYVDIAIDVVFLFDIALCFLTAYEDQGFTVRECAGPHNHVSTLMLPHVFSCFSHHNEDTSILLCMSSQGTLLHILCICVRIIIINDSVTIRHPPCVTIRHPPCAHGRASPLIAAPVSRAARRRAVRQVPQDRGALPQHVVHPRPGGLLPLRPRRRRRRGGVGRRRAEPLGHAPHPHPQAHPRRQVGRRARRSAVTRDAGNITLELPRP